MILLWVDNDKTQNEKVPQCRSRQRQNAGQHQPSPYKEMNVLPEKTDGYHRDDDVLLSR